MKNIHSRFFIFFFEDNDQCRRFGGGGGGGGRDAVPPLMAACAPIFGLLKILFLEHHTMTRQQTVMEKLLYINLTQ